MNMVTKHRPETDKEKNPAMVVGEPAGMWRRGKEGGESGFEGLPVFALVSVPSEHDTPSFT